MAATTMEPAKPLAQPTFIPKSTSDVGVECTGSLDLHLEAAANARPKPPLLRRIAPRPTQAADAAAALFALRAAPVEEAASAPAASPVEATSTAPDPTPPAAAPTNAPAFCFLDDQPRAAVDDQPRATEDQQRAAGTRDQERDAAFDALLVSARAAKSEERSRRRRGAPRGYSGSGGRTRADEDRRPLINESSLDVRVRRGANRGAAAGCHGDIPRTYIGDAAAIVPRGASIATRPASAPFRVPRAVPQSRSGGC